MEQSDNKQRVSRICEFVSGRGLTVGSLLDIGAGIGVFASEMQKKGWSVMGLEMDEMLVHHLNNYVGIKAMNVSLSDLKPDEAGLFDFIALNKVLEHVEEPALLLQQAKNFLRSDGLVYAEVPDTRALEIGPDREEFYIEHHHVFTKLSLKAMFVNTGITPLSIRAIAEPSGKFTLFAFGEVFKNAR